MTSKLTITDERLAELVAFKPLPGTDINSATRDEWMAMAAELHERRNAAMDSEPVAWLWSRDDERDVSLTPPDDDEDAADAIECGWTATPLYRHAQPAPVAQPVMFIDGDISSEDADKLAKVTREFNEEDERPLAKMARIIRENPHPTNECDMPKSQTQPAPALPDFDDVLESLDYEVRCNARESEHVMQACQAMYDACRAAMLNHPSSIQPNTDAAPGTEIKHPSSNSPVIPGAEQRISDAVELLKKAAPAMLADNVGPDGPLAGRMKSPVIPEGYVMVPMRLTAENGAKAALLGEFNLEYTLTCHECFGEGCDDCSGEGTWTSTMPIDWTTIKEIWDKAINHFAAAQREVKGE